MDQSFSKVTIYHRTMLPISPIGFAKIEATTAEYRGGRSITFKQPRQRAWRTFHDGPPIVVLDGWGHPDPPPIWTTDDRGFTTNRYSGTSIEYLDDFNFFLDAYLSASHALVLVDTRDEPEIHVYATPPGPVGIHNQLHPSELDIDEHIPYSGLVPSEGLVEGSQYEDVVLGYERNQEARKICLAHFGRICQACEADLVETYGDLGPNIIQVHHLIPLSEIGTEYTVDPIKDLVPVCPNCHTMLHQRTPPFTVIELRQMMT